MPVPPRCCSAPEPWHFRKHRETPNARRSRRLCPDPRCRRFEGAAVLRPNSSVPREQGEPALNGVVASLELAAQQVEKLIVATRSPEQPRGSQHAASKRGPRPAPQEKSC